MNSQIIKMQDEKELYSFYAKQARDAGAFDVEQDWLMEVAELQVKIEKMLHEIAEEGRIARQNRIADIASGRYRRPIAFG